MDFISKLLCEASYNKDKKLHDTAINILDEIKNRLKTNKNLHYGNSFIFTKLGDLEIYLYNLNSSVSQQKVRSGVNAEFFPDKFTPKIISYRNIFQGKGKPFDISDEFLYHEIIHYLDLKRSKDKDFMNKIGKKQVASQRSSESEYYNSSAEFNTYFMQYVFRNIEKFLLQKEDLGSFNEFKNQVINLSSNSKYFFKALNEKNYKKALKRLYIVYNNVQKNEKASENVGENVKVATKQERFLLLKKLKNFFTNAS